MSDDDLIAYWRELYHEVKTENDRLKRIERVDNSIAKQLSLSMACNARYNTVVLRYADALLRIQALDKKNIAQQIADQALKGASHDRTQRPDQGHPNAATDQAAPDQ